MQKEFPIINEKYQHSVLKREESNKVFSDFRLVTSSVVAVIKILHFQYLKNI